MKKKLIASAVSLTMLFTTAFCGIGTPVYATETTSEDLPELITEDYEFYRDPETGHIGVVENDITSYSVSGDDDEISPNGTVPSAYGGFSTIKNTYPCTRNQNPYGTCWAFAATACAEFDMVKNHGVSSSTADFSELQLAWFNYHTGYVLEGLDDDEVWIPSGAKSYLDVGGNVLFSMHTLAQWKSYAYESSLKYSNVTSNSAYEVNKYMSTYHNAAQLRGVKYLDIKNDPDSVKQAIMDHGAVYISYYHDSDYYSLNGYSLYYNPDSSTGTNHDVVIVGWNDNLAASNWPSGNRPSSNGAWLVRNSWSTDQSTASEYTYFYMSYEDASLAGTAYSLDFEPGSQTDNLYQHDGSTTHSYVYTTSVANVFSRSNNGSKTQRLDSVMIPFTGDTNVNYKIEIYTGLTSSDPRSGYLNSSATTTGWTDSKGIYTIDLNNPVYLYPNEKFAVVVTALNGYTNFDIENSRSITYTENGTTKSWFSTTASADSGESFIYSNGSYIDATAYNDSSSLYSYETGNICVKAITENTTYTKYKVTYNLNGGTNSTANPNGYLNTQSGSFTLKDPSRSGYHFCGWYSDSGFTNKVTAIDYDSNTSLTLYAKWCSDSSAATTTIVTPATTSAAGSYKVTCNGCGLLKGTYTVPQISSVKLSYSRLAYTGANRSPVPIITDSSGNKLVNGTDYTYTYSKSTRKNTGRYYVTVTFKGKYSGSQKLWFTVVPAAPSTAGAKLYGYNDIKVTWSKATGASGYYVYYKKSTASTYTNYKITTNRYINFVNLAGNTKYNFKIVPYYKNGNTKYKSTKSKVVSATTLKKLKQPSMSNVSGGRVSLYWESISGASGYQVYWSSKKASGYSKLCDYSSAYVGVTFSVTAGKTYWYKTRAYKTVNGKRIYGPWSTPKSYKR